MVADGAILQDSCEAPHIIYGPPIPPNLMLTGTMAVPEWQMGWGLCVFYQETTVQGIFVMEMESLLEVGRGLHHLPLCF